MIDKALYDIKEYKLINQGDTIVLGISGGPDSVCLLHFLCSLRDSMKLKIHAVHVNHMLREEESDGDENFVKELCSQFCVEFKAVHIDIKRIAREKRISLEEAGREARYIIFESTADTVGAEKIAVAHNKNDQVETVLMNLIRGTGLEGLGGMDYKRGRIIRPLLGVERKDIEDYCARFNLKPRIDSSNLETVYTRNKVRLHLIPHINKLFSLDIVKSISKMIVLLKDENDFIDKYIDHLSKDIFIDSKSGEKLIDLELFVGFHIAAKRRIIRKVIQELRGSTRGIGNVHINSILDLSQSGSTGSVLHLPSGLRVLKSYKTLKIYQCNEVEENIGFDVELNIPGLTAISETGNVIEASLNDDIVGTENCCRKSSSLEQFFDYEKIKGVINVRGRKNGDVFKPFNSTGTKKLKEYFIDNKIPREERDSIPLITIGKEVVWIIGHKISDKFKVSENTKKVLKLAFKNNVKCK